jgi:hypothetical protein
MNNQVCSFLSGRVLGLELVLESLGYGLEPVISVLGFEKIFAKV